MVVRYSHGISAEAESQENLMEEKVRKRVEEEREGRREGRRGKDTRSWRHLYYIKMAT